MAEKNSRKRKIGAPHVYTIIMMLVIIAYALAWILPSGQFDRIYDEATESELVVAGSYHAVEKDYPDIFDLFTAIQRGYVEIADITFFIFFAYGFMYLLTKNGTLNALIGLLLRQVLLKGHGHKGTDFHLFAYDLELLHAPPVQSAQKSLHQSRKR